MYKYMRGNWFLGTSVMKKYFHVLDVSGMVDESDKKIDDGKVYLGISECTKHMNIMNLYW